MTKQYLGDGVYADTQFGSVKVSTENGVEETNVIILEPEVARALVEYIERVEEGWKR